MTGMDHQQYTIDLIESRPMRFLRTEKRCGGEMLLHHFVDDETGTERIVEDFS